MWASLWICALTAIVGSTPLPRSYIRDVKARNETTRDVVPVLDHNITLLSPPAALPRGILAARTPTGPDEPDDIDEAMIIRFLPLIFAMAKDEAASKPTTEGHGSDVTGGSRMYCDPRTQSLEQWATADNNLALIGELVSVASKVITLRQRNHYQSYPINVLSPEEISRAQQMQRAGDEDQSTTIETRPSFPTLIPSPPSESADEHYACITAKQVEKQTKRNKRKKRKMANQDKKAQLEIARAEKIEHATQKLFVRVHEAHKGVNWERVQYLTGNTMIYLSCGLQCLNPEHWASALATGGSNAKNNALWDRHQEAAYQSKKKAQKAAKKAAKKAGKQAQKGSPGRDEETHNEKRPSPLYDHHHEEDHDEHSEHIAPADPLCYTKPSDTIIKALQEVSPYFDSERGRHTLERLEKIPACLNTNLEHGLNEVFDSSAFSDNLHQTFGGAWHHPQ